jgi:hypothetical protein
MGRTRRGQPGADVEELADAQAASGMPGHPAAKGPVGPCRGDDLRPQPGHFLPGRPVCRIVVFATEPERIDPRWVRDPRVEPRWQVARRGVGLRTGLSRYAYAGIARDG